MASNKTKDRMKRLCIKNRKHIENFLLPNIIMIYFIGNFT